MLYIIYIYGVKHILVDGCYACYACYGMTMETMVIPRRISSNNGWLSIPDFHHKKTDHPPIFGLENVSF
jgi:hypothetical protein